MIVEKGSSWPYLTKSRFRWNSMMTISGELKFYVSANTRYVHKM